jgi:hypothetical protein
MPVRLDLAILSVNLTVARELPGKEHNAKEKRGLAAIAGSIAEQKLVFK